ncbi:OLC1v1016922C1 [Oldenlandia corymbosa var. corymbosa]|uniref:OLC1v1016922C1 n=1 Tax=Oldenlandia corymbosa var. corymbosa TaxID=529605 RepID=A0AAV1E891_OLDCO|nr:OLC1v1016922C1 [Oldenlandia corymbosa var. corymbosa]
MVWLDGGGDRMVLIHTDAPSSSAQGKKLKREAGEQGTSRKHFWVWAHYEVIVEFPPETQRAKYLYYEASLSCATKNVTSCLINHLIRCQKCPFNIEAMRTKLELGAKVGKGQKRTRVLPPSTPGFSYGRFKLKDVTKIFEAYGANIAKDLSKVEKILEALFVSYSSSLVSRHRDTSSQLVDLNLNDMIEGDVIVDVASFLNSYFVENEEDENLVDVAKGKILEDCYYYGKASMSLPRVILGTVANRT